MARHWWRLRSMKKAWRKRGRKNSVSPSAFIKL